MHQHRAAGLGAILVLTAVTAPAQAPAPTSGHRPLSATALAPLYGGPVDPDTATHRFERRVDGGRIEMLHANGDAAGVDHIRRHLRHLSGVLASGEITGTAFAQVREAPGIAVIAARKGRIEYAYRDLPRGAELRLVTTDAEALRAIHQLMDHGTKDHRLHGPNHPPHGPRNHPPHGAGHRRPHGTGDHHPAGHGSGTP